MGFLNLLGNKKKHSNVGLSKREVKILTTHWQVHVNKRDLDLEEFLGLAAWQGHPWLYRTLEVCNPKVRKMEEMGRHITDKDGVAESIQKKHQNHLPPLLSHLTPDRRRNTE